MRLAFALFLILLPGCATQTPQLEYPSPYVQYEVRIEVDGVYRRGLGVYGAIAPVAGITGTATNLTGRELKECTIYFDIEDSSGVKVGYALAHAHGLRAGQQWRFRADFTTPFETSFKSIRPSRVIIL